MYIPGHNIARSSDVTTSMGSYQFATQIIPQTYDDTTLSTEQNQETHTPNDIIFAQSTGVADIHEADHSSQESLICRPLQALTPRSSSQAARDDISHGTASVVDTQLRSGFVIDSSHRPVLSRVERSRPYGILQRILAGRNSGPDRVDMTSLSYATDIPLDQQTILASEGAVYPSLPGRPLRPPTVPIRLQKQWEAAVNRAAAANANAPVVITADTTRITASVVDKDESVVQWSSSPPQQVIIGETVARRLDVADFGRQRSSFSTTDNSSSVPALHEQSAECRRLSPSARTPLLNPSEPRTNETQSLDTSSYETLSRKPRVLVKDTPLPSHDHERHLPHFENTQTSCIAATFPLQPEPCNASKTAQPEASENARSTLRPSVSCPGTSQEVQLPRESRYERNSRLSRSSMSAVLSGTSKGHVVERNTCGEETPILADISPPRKRQKVHSSNQTSSSEDSPDAETRRLRECLLARRKALRAMSKKYIKSGPDDNDAFCEENVPRAKAALAARRHARNTKMTKCEQVPGMSQKNLHRNAQIAVVINDEVTAATTKKRKLPWSDFQSKNAFTSAQDVVPLSAASLRLSPPPRSPSPVLEVMTLMLPEDCEKQDSSHKFEGPILGSSPPGTSEPIDLTSDLDEPLVGSLQQVLRRPRRRRKGHGRIQRFLAQWATLQNVGMLDPAPARSRGHVVDFYSW